MGRRVMIVVVSVLAMMVSGSVAARAEGPLPIGTVNAVTGTVEVGRDGVWKPALVKMHLFDGETLRAAAGSGADIVFDGDVPAKLGEKTEIAVADLQLKAQLEKARAKIGAPADTTKATLEVTPLTGVRGTEKTEEKAGELKREHYWNESAPAAK
ncbi:MAG: FecR family protein [Candidatus Methylomirabilia bacterium]